jgi:hypothetical protein
MSYITFSVLLKSMVWTGMFMFIRTLHGGDDNDDVLLGLGTVWTGW